MSITLAEPPSRTVDPDAFLRGIDALLPELRARSAEVERRRMIPPDLIARLRDADVFRAVQPRQWGGLEMHPATFYQGMTRIASACGSTGWVASVVGIHPWHVAMFDPRAQQEVWGDDPDTMASTSYAPTGTVRRVPGGFRLSGRWHYSSGVDHCAWVILGGIAPDDGRDSLGPEYFSFLVPSRDFTIDQDSWHVVGLSGTGSKDVILDDAFVPDHRAHSATQVWEKTDPGLAVNDRPLYRLPWPSVFSYAIASPAIGAAMGALDLFIQNNRARISITNGRTVSASTDLHIRLTESAMEIDAARTRLTQTWTDFMDRTGRGEDIPYVMRARARYEAAHALAHAAGAVFRLLEINGARSMHQDAPFQRLFRDILAMRNHIAATMELNATLYASALLGAPPPPFTRDRRPLV
jgi:3-hydroxy-9,10-secoandrosta-1,3,5(10)-triene-9,17-dione monooxygenase